MEQEKTNPLINYRVEMQKHLAEIKLQVLNGELTEAQGKELTKEVHDYIREMDSIALAIIDVLELPPGEKQEEQREALATKMLNRLTELKRVN